MSYHDGIQATERLKRQPTIIAALVTDYRQKANSIQNDGRLSDKGKTDQEGSL